MEHTKIFFHYFSKIGFDDKNSLMVALYVIS